MDSCLIGADKTIKAKVVLDERIRLIAASAFQGNRVLARIELPKTLRRIDHDTFRDCKNLQKCDSGQ